MPTLCNASSHPSNAKIIEILVCRHTTLQLPQEIGFGPNQLLFPVPLTIIHNDDDSGKNKHANKKNRYGHFYSPW
jgi:hypothetical protein